MAAPGVENTSFRSNSEFPCEAAASGAAAVCANVDAFSPVAGDALPLLMLLGGAGRLGEAFAWVIVAVAV